MSVTPKLYAYLSALVVFVNLLAAGVGVNLTIAASIALLAVLRFIAIIIEEC